ncbi:acyltransferase family protein [Fodinibacter luteus]|uniref:acyltransferase family protein n=1 Tax=Fodinibacter luteus TaxID=552064 RepID=UPI0031E5144A
MREPPTARRGDVEGLRAVAVLLVVTYHVWLGRVSGGVDVFLLVSAFFLTGGLVRRLDAGERVSVARHWLRVFHRLVPTAGVVVAATVLAGVVLLPAVRWRGLLVDAVGSMTYTENWVLALRAVDYYAADKGSASPLQHMWSLSLQGQAFLLWPVLLVALAALARRTGWLTVRGLAGLGLGAVALTSFAWAVHSTATRQAFAYFDGAARVWELALGGLLALVVHRVQVPAAVAVPLGWLGAAGLVSCGLLLDVTGTFPGWAALWPLLSASAIILAGTAPGRWGVGRVLATSPLVTLGGISYALYLVHWPVLVLWLATSGRERAGMLDGAVVVVASLALAWLLSRAVERPVRALPWLRDAPWRSAGLVLGTAAAVATVSVAGIVRLDGQARRGAELSAGAEVPGYPGARAVHEGLQVAAVAPEDRLPAVTALRREWASLPGPCRGDWSDARLGSACTQLEPAGTPTASVVVVGDSHAEQWLAAVRPIAEEHGWRVVALLEGGCSFGAASTRTGGCADFNLAATAYLRQRPVDLVVTVSTAAHPTTTGERLVPGYAEVVRELTMHGVPVVGLRDNPRFTYAVAACVLENGDRDCSPRVAQKLAPSSPADALVGVDGFTSIDLTDLICPEGVCVPSVGNVWVYLDDNHLTRSFGATLSSALSDRLMAAGAWPEPDPGPPVVAGHLGVAGGPGGQVRR